MASEMKSETGEVIREFKASEKPISSSAFLCGEFASHACCIVDLYFFFLALMFYLFLFIRQKRKFLL